MSRNIAIIFAGGSGARMGSGIPKQFIEINGKPIIIHTLDIFEESDLIDDIYIACKEDCITKLERMIRRFVITKVRKVVPGGATGQDSIYNALTAAREDCPGDSVVLIHDGVRPCISNLTIADNLRCVQEHGNSVTCTAMYETPVVSHDEKTVDELPPRKNFYTAQAPQCFHLDEVLEAHAAERETNPSYTGIVDTCTLMKKHGHEIAITKGPRGNIKVTTPEDLYLFRAMLQYREIQNVFGFNHTEMEANLKK